MSIQPEGRAVLYRPVIGGGGAEVSDMCHIGPTYGMAAAVIWAICAWYKVVPLVGRILIPTSNLFAAIGRVLTN